MKLKDLKYFEDFSSILTGDNPEKISLFELLMYASKYCLSQGWADKAILIGTALMKLCLAMEEDDEETDECNQSEIQ